MIIPSASDRLFYRPFNYEDICPSWRRGYHTIGNHKQFTSLEDARRWIDANSNSIKSISDIASNSTIISFAICEKTSNTMVGWLELAFNVDLSEKDKRDHFVPYYAGKGTFIAYWIDLKHRKRGYATEAINTASEHIFNQTTEDELFAITLAKNVASIKTLGKANFNFRVADSENHSFHLYSITRSEWLSKEK